jgi:ADP-heptose:LPS heptosyltransferase
VIDLAPELTSWARTAAAVMQHDLVISVATSMAHLAGALGRPVWICLDTPGEWRWAREWHHYAWYDSA